MYSRFPEELIPLVDEFRKRAKRLLVGPGGVLVLYRLNETMVLWWKKNEEIGVGDGSGKRFVPILVTMSYASPAPVVEWGSEEEIQTMMEILRMHMVLDDLADV